jgi:hypothetical protein
MGLGRVKTKSPQIIARRKPLYVCNAPDNDQIPHLAEMSRRANYGLMHCGKERSQGYRTTP